MASTDITEINAINTVGLQNATVTIKTHYTGTETGKDLWVKYWLWSNNDQTWKYYGTFDSVTVNPENIRSWIGELNAVGNDWLWLYAAAYEWNNVDGQSQWQKSGSSGKWVWWSGAPDISVSIDSVDNTVGMKPFNVTYSWSNIGNADAKNVNLTLSHDGEILFEKSPDSFIAAGSSASETIGPISGFLGNQDIELKLIANLSNDSNTDNNTAILNVHFNGSPNLVLSEVNISHFAAHQALDLTYKITNIGNGLDQGWVWTAFLGDNGSDSIGEWRYIYDGRLPNGSYTDQFHISSGLNPGWQYLMIHNDDENKSMNGGWFFFRDPNNPYIDEDEDSIDDTWEMAVFGNLNANSSSDYDNDGVLDADDINPLDPQQTGTFSISITQPLDQQTY